MSFDFVSPMVAAACAIVPAYPGFVAKSALQMGKCVPPFQSLFKGVATAIPLTGVIVGTQIVAQKGFEKVTQMDPKQFSTMAMSSVVVAGASVYPLAALNGLTAGQGAWESMVRVTRGTAFAIVMREATFLGPLRMSEWFNGKMKEQFGDHPIVDYASTFNLNAAGSVLGTPFDTALTRMQASLALNQWSVLKYAIPVRAVAVGTFAVSYRFFDGLLK